MKTGSERRAAIARGKRVEIASTKACVRDEKAFMEREQQEILNGHGPVRVFMQGGKKCNETR